MLIFRALHRFGSACRARLANPDTVSTAQIGKASSYAPAGQKPGQCVLYTVCRVHELSIAYNLVEAASKAASEAGARMVTAVRLRLGMLSGVVPDALQFGYDIAIKDTLLEGSRLEIEEVPVIIHCERCRREVTLPTIQVFRCPICNTPSAQIVQGRELEIVSLEINDGNPTS